MKKRIPAVADPKKPFRRKQWEQYTLLLLEGVTAYEAYRTVYPGSKKWKRNSVDNKASLLTAKIEPRLQHLRERETSKKILSLDRRKELLSKTAEEVLEAKLSDYVEGGKDGAWIKYGPESPRQGAVAELTTMTKADDTGDTMTITTKIKLHSKSDGISAIQELNKMDGVYKQQNTLLPDGMGVAIVYVSPDEKKKKG